MYQNTERGHPVHQNMGIPWDTTSLEALNRICFFRQRVLECVNASQDLCTVTARRASARGVNTSAYTVEHTPHQGSPRVVSVSHQARSFSAVRPPPSHERASKAILLYAPQSSHLLPILLVLTGALFSDVRC